jgi:hypothetical protein
LIHAASAQLLLPNLALKQVKRTSCTRFWILGILVHDRGQGSVRAEQRAAEHAVP